MSQGLGWMLVSGPRLATFDLQGWGVSTRQAEGGCMLLSLPPPGYRQGCVLTHTPAVCGHVAGVLLQGRHVLCWAGVHSPGACWIVGFGGVCCGGWSVGAWLVGVGCGQTVVKGDVLGRHPQPKNSTAAVRAFPLSALSPFLSLAHSLSLLCWHSYLWGHEGLWLPLSQPGVPVCICNMTCRLRLPAAPATLTCQTCARSLPTRSACMHAQEGQSRRHTCVAHQVCCKPRVTRLTLRIPVCFRTIACAARPAHCTARLASP